MTLRNICSASKRLTLPILCGTIATLLSAGSSSAAPYASNVTFITPTTVSFILNEPADSLKVSINGGAPIALEPAFTGPQTFQLNSPTDTFQIIASKTDSVGYTIPTGATIAVPSSGGLGQPTAEGGFRQISNDSNTLVHFNSPRGITVATDPNNPQFGTTYISNSAIGTNSGRSLGDGLYALRADQSDAFGMGNLAISTGFEGSSSPNSPYRLAIGPDHKVYIADWADANGNVYRMNGDLTSPTQVLAGIGGPTTLPAGQNHGSVSAVALSGSAGGSLTLYTLDEDLTTAQVTGTGSTSDRNSVWKYDITGSAQPYAAMPTKVNSANILLPNGGIVNDVEIGRNGKFYVTQSRLAGGEAGLFVLNANGTTAFDSLTASRALLGDPLATDIIRNIQGIALSLDMGYLALMLNDSDVAVLRLSPDGIPDLASRLVINTGGDILSGRDIAFDAAGNIHYVSSGQGIYRVLAPGGFTESVTSWNGTSFSFASIPEPSAALGVLCGSVLLLRRRRR